MSLMAEICLYLFVVLGLICVTMTTFNFNYSFKEKYVREKNIDTKVQLELKFTGESDAVIQETSYALANARFDNIYDLVDEFKVYKKDEE